MAFTITQTQLEQMKNVDIQTVDRDFLVDIQTIQADTSLPKNERILSFMVCRFHVRILTKRMWE